MATEYKIFINYSKNFMAVKPNMTAKQGILEGS